MIKIITIIVMLNASCAQADVRQEVQHRSAVASYYAGVIYSIDLLEMEARPEEYKPGCCADLPKTESVQ
jgi:hypothetical protein